LLQAINSFFNDFGVFPWNFRLFGGWNRPRPQFFAIIQANHWMKPSFDLLLRKPRFFAVEFSDSLGGVASGEWRRGFGRATSLLKSGFGGTISQLRLGCV